MHTVQNFFMRLFRKSVGGSSFYRSAVSLVLIGLFSSMSWADDPFGSSTLAPNKNDMLKNMSFDQVNWKRPQGV
ncbi:MAG: hypothetical protein R3B95_21595, partial [Nitrospirales bacterium]|nr:hypothetical protein [Nitrospirales bacterium]